LILAAQDDPIVPFHSFDSPKLRSEYITLLAPEHGGHGGFVQSEPETDERLRPGDRQWAHNRILEFCMNLDAHAHNRE
jgi:predicted alpha/beta-fold hydrolase